MVESKGKTQRTLAPEQADRPAIMPHSARPRRRFDITRFAAHSKGFTLLELMIVLAIMGILITIAQPRFMKSLVRAREAVLMEDLYSMRDAIDQFYADNGKYPDALVDLVSSEDNSKSYLRGIPTDPFTRAEDWITVAPEEGDEGGVFDVHSASPLIGLNGTAYNTW